MEQERSRNVAATRVVEATERDAAAGSVAGFGANGHVPPLENGDHLTRAEFERRYEAMPELKKAELIEGVVYVGSPVRIDRHGWPHSIMVAWVVNYCAATPGLIAGDNSTVRLDLDNEPQPDVLLCIEEAAGGRARVDEDGYVDGAPELVVEVAASSASIDRNAKLRAYRRNGVQEYVIWRVLDGVVDWLALQEGDYVPLPPDESGVVRSSVFPGLALHVPALLAGRLADVLATQQRELGSDEHRRFVERLAPARESGA
jgi:Uma2 family endonuclease